MSVCHSSPGRERSKRRAGFALRRGLGAGSRFKPALSTTRLTLERLTFTPTKRHSHALSFFNPKLG